MTPQPATCNLDPETLAKVLRCSLRQFDRHLNTPETRYLKRLCARLGIRADKTCNLKPAP